jgi:hypothetical protein
VSGGRRTAKKSADGDESAAPSRLLSQPRSVTVLDPEQVRAAVTVALDAAMPMLIDQLTERVVAGLAGKKPEPKK